MFGGGTSTEYDDIVVKTTDENLTGENWELIMNLCDKVADEGQSGAHSVVAAILKRLAHRNPNVQLYALSLAEALSKNLGIEIRRELASRAFTQGLEKLITDRNTHDKVRKRALGLIAVWTEEFEGDTTLGIMEDCYNNLKAKNYKFESLNDAPPPTVDDEIRRKEEEELQRVLEMSMQDKGGRDRWAQYTISGSSGAGGSGSGSSAPGKASSSAASGSGGGSSSSHPFAQPKYQAGYVPARTPSPVAQPPPPQASQTARPQPQAQPSYTQSHSSQSQYSAVASSSAPSLPTTSTPVVASTPAPTVPAASTSPAPASTASNMVTRVRALYTFEPTEPGELAFEKGEIIKVVDRGYKDWWRGQLKGRTGIFPVNYVEPLPEPTAAEVAKEAEQEAAVFSQAVNVEKLLASLRALDPAKDNLADNEEIQELYRSCMALRPKIVKLIDKYSQKRADLVSMNETFVRARTIFDRMMEESLARHTGVYEPPYRPGPQPYQAPRPDSRPAPQAFGWNPAVFEQPGYNAYPAPAAAYPPQGPVVAPQQPPVVVQQPPQGPTPAPYGPIPVQPQQAPPHGAQSPYGAEVPQNPYAPQPQPGQVGPQQPGQAGYYGVQAPQQQPPQPQPQQQQPPVQNVQPQQPYGAPTTNPYGAPGPQPQQQQPPAQAQQPPLNPQQPPLQAQPSFQAQPQAQAPPFQSQPSFQGQPQGAPLNAQQQQQQQQQQPPLNPSQPGVGPGGYQAQSPPVTGAGLPVQPQAQHNLGQHQPQQNPSHGAVPQDQHPNPYTAQPIQTQPQTQPQSQPQIQSQVQPVVQPTQTQPPVQQPQTDLLNTPSPYESLSPIGGGGVGGNAQGGQFGQPLQPTQGPAQNQPYGAQSPQPQNQTQNQNQNPYGSSSNVTNPAAAATSPSTAGPGAGASTTSPGPSASTTTSTSAATSASASAPAPSTSPSNASSDQPLIISGPPPYIFNPRATYADPNAHAWAQYYAQGGKELTGAVYFVSVPGVTDGASGGAAGAAAGGAADGSAAGAGGAGLGRAQSYQAQGQAQGQGQGQAQGQGQYGQTQGQGQQQPQGAGSPVGRNQSFQPSSPTAQHQQYHQPYGASPSGAEDANSLAGRFRGVQLQDGPSPARAASPSNSFGGTAPLNIANRRNSGLGQGTGSATPAWGVPTSPQGGAPGAGSGGGFGARATSPPAGGPGGGSTPSWVLPRPGAVSPGGAHGGRFAQSRGFSDDEELR